MCPLTHARNPVAVHQGYVQRCRAARGIRVYFASSAFFQQSRGEGEGKNWQRTRGEEGQTEAERSKGLEGRKRRRRGKIK